jgi:glucose-1-phosphate cytidylyltransferase
MTEKVALKPNGWDIGPSRARGRSLDRTPRPARGGPSLPPLPTKMKVAILAGGMGTRLAEETDQRPKPMVEIGGKPILWHIMKHYSEYGMDEFVIALGYKKEAIIRYFVDLHYYSSDLTIRTGDGSITVHRERRREPDWTVHLVDTGALTETGGRLKRLAPYIADSTFMLTWCDGLSDVDLTKLFAFHRAHGKLATVTTVRAPARFGYVELDGADVSGFREKSIDDERWINGAFFVLEPGVLDYIEGDDTSWERGPMVRLAADKQLAAYRHDSFWQCMDTLREKRLLEDLWNQGQAPWKTWE